MKQLFTTILLFTVFHCAVFSQVSDSAGVPGHDETPFYGDHVWVRFCLEAGLTNIHPEATNNVLFGNGGFDQLTTLGGSESVSFEPLLGNNLFGHDMSFGIHWYIADKKPTHVGTDRYEYKLDGWELMTSVIGFDAFANRNIDLVVGGGMYWGNLTLHQANITDSTEAKKYINPFVAPMARAELRVNFRMITLGVRYVYRYDITHDNWQRRSEQLNPIPGYRFRDSQFMFYFGLRGPFV